MGVGVLTPGPNGSERRSGRRRRLGGKQMAHYDTAGLILFDRTWTRYGELRESFERTGRDRPLSGQQQGLTRRTLLLVADSLISLGNRIREHYGRPASAGAAWSG